MRYGESSFACFADVRSYMDRLLGLWLYHSAVVGSRVWTKLGGSEYVLSGNHRSCLRIPGISKVEKQGFGLMIKIKIVHLVLLSVVFAPLGSSAELISFAFCPTNHGEKPIFVVSERDKKKWHRDTSFYCRLKADICPKDMARDEDDSKFCVSRSYGLYRLCRHAEMDSIDEKIARRVCAGEKE